MATQPTRDCVCVPVRRAHIDADEVELLGADGLYGGPVRLIVDVENNSDREVVADDDRCSAGDVCGRRLSSPGLV